MPIVVDDTIDATTSPSLREMIHRKLKERFSWKPLGLCSWFLGARVTQSFSSIAIDQTAYLVTIIEKFSLYEIKKANTSMKPGTVLDFPDQNLGPTTFSYASLVDSLIWMTKT